MGRYVTHGEAREFLRGVQDELEALEVREHALNVYEPQEWPDDEWYTADDLREERAWGKGL